jgi:hypothetical protein
MSVPANILQQVQTYQLSGLAFMQNLNCFIGTANTKFKNFNQLEANLGSTVTFDLPPRMTTTNSLVASFQPADQRVQSLVVDQQQSVSYEFTAQQFIFNVKDYMERFGKAAIIELGAQIESNVAENCVTNTYRFYGDGVTPINSYGQLASALAFFRNYGAIGSNVKGYLSDIAVAAIVNSGLNQFAMDRNNKIANSWEVGMFSKCDWYQSNLLPIHTAGNVGINGTTLTVVSTTLDSLGAVTSITFSGATASDASAVLQYDKFEFQDGVSGQPNLRYLTFVGHKVSQNPVQFAATANAGATGGGQVTVTITPALQVNAVNTQNINHPIVAGMQVKALPSHRAGLICSGNPLFLAMPSLPDQTPFPTGNAYDPDTGVALRQYYGAQFGLNAMGMVHDCIWGSTLVPENSMALIFPL